MTELAAHFRFTDDEKVSRWTVDPTLIVHRVLD